MSIVTLLLLLYLAGPVSAGGLSAGEKWERSNGNITVAAIYSDVQATGSFDFDHYMDMGFNAAFIAQLKWRHDGQTVRSTALNRCIDTGLLFISQQGSFQNRDRPVWNHPLHAAHFEGDEAVPDELHAQMSGLPSFSSVANMVKSIRTESPELVIIGSVYPSLVLEPGVLARYLKTTEADIFVTTGSYVNYPVPPSSWFAMLGAIRQACLAQRTGKGAAGIPYWLWLSHAPAFGIDVNEPAKAEGRHRQQLYSCLAYGFTGIIYFTFNGWVNPAYSGMVAWDADGRGRPTPFSKLVRQTNREALNLGRCLVWLTSTDVRWVRGRRNVNVDDSTRQDANPTPPGVLPFEWFVDDPYLWSADTDGHGPGRNILVGCFKDDKDSRYFMVANQSWHDEQTVKLTFDFDKLKNSRVVAGLVHMNKDTGQAQRIKLTSSRFEHVKDQQYRLSLTLPPGDGELFMYDDGTEMQTGALIESE